MAFDILSFVIGQQTAKGSGGGSVEGVHFVTFMNEDGTQELYKRPVADGDDCADPVKRGLIDEPTKESTAQYNYTHVGWSASPNGALDENILKAVTADKTVYANFAAVLRYYTVTYYDDDGTTVLKTETLAYGATPPAYTPEKSGVSFDGWEPEIATVTGDATYTAKWVEAITFAGATWEKINEICEAGKSENYFAVGDKRNVVGTDGETYVLTIIGMNIDKKSDGSGNAGITVSVKKPDNVAATDAKPINSTDWTKSTDWTNSDCRYYLRYAFKSLLPDEVSSLIKTVSKRRLKYTDYTIAGKLTLDETVFIPSLYEYSLDTNNAASETIQYPGLDTKEERKLYDSEGKACYYWSCTPQSYGRFYCISGALSTTTMNTVSTSLRMVPCFCI